VAIILPKGRSGIKQELLGDNRASNSRRRGHKARVAHTPLPCVVGVSVFRLTYVDGCFIVMGADMYMNPFKMHSPGVSAFGNVTPTSLPCRLLLSGACYCLHVSR
jgi:hypothetical protein